MGKPKTIKFDDYVETRKKKSPEFAEGFEDGYRDFEIGVMLKNAREKAGMTQDERGELDPFL